MDFPVKKIQKTGIPEKNGSMPHACENDTSYSLHYCIFLDF